MNFITSIVLWLFLNIMIGLTMDFALFTQTTKSMENSNIYLKILTSEFWATIEWMFVIPSIRIGNTFLNPVQISLSSYIFDFLAQLWSNYFWLNLPTSIDDYCGMFIIFFGMVVSKIRVFG